jgi:hypothetical protein
VRRQLWGDWGTIHANAKVDLGSRCFLTSCEIDPDWWAVGLSTNEGTRFQGHHAPFILIIIDEGFGVADEIFEVVDGYMTAAGSEGTMVRLLAIGNPTTTTGALARAFKEERALWNQISISAFDSPNVHTHADGTPKKPEELEPDLPDEVRRLLVGDEWVADMETKWGKDSPFWYIRVLGEFSPIADDVVISLAQIEAAQAREIEPKGREHKVIACDPARFGSDETVIARRYGDRVRIVESIVGQDTMTTTGRIVQEWNQDKQARVVVDSIGIGAGICDRLREQLVPVEEFNAGGKPIDKAYRNARDEMWFRGREMVPMLDLDPDDQLAADLSAPTYAPDSQGRMTVEPKDKTKKRLGRSPDRADAVLMTLVPPEGTGRKGPSRGWQSW